MTWRARLALGLAIGATTLAGAGAGAAPGAPVAPANGPEQAELAERLLQTAQRMATVPQAQKVAAALADIADKFYADDARLLRTAVDLRLALGQRDQAIALLTAYRKLDAADQIAMVQSIDLQQSKLESATARASYLTAVANSNAVPAEVRSHAATLLAAVEMERGRDAAATDAVSQALALNPLNPKALRMRADAMAVGGTAAQRTAAWVGILTADPMEYAVASRLGEELIHAGLTDAATGYYRSFFGSIEAAGFGPGADDSINYANLLVLANRLTEANQVIGDAIKDYPADVRLQMVRAMLAEAGKDDAGFKAAVGDARTAATRNLMALHGQLNPSAPAMDPSTAVALPDLKVDADLAAKADPRLANAELRALMDLARLDVNFNGPTDALVFDAIKTLAGADSVVVHRLAGYAALQAGRLDEADNAFAPVTERDALSRLGQTAVKLKRGGDKATIVAEGGKSLGELSTDVWPMLIRRTLKDAGPISFKGPDADAVAAEAAKLPKDTFTFPTSGQATYLVDVTPVGGSVEIGAPIFVRVSMQNISDHPIAIGPGGAVQQQVSLDATVQGVTQQGFGGVATAKMTSVLVLKPRQAINATVRLDSPELSAFLGSIPQAGASVFVSGVTNPLTRQNTVLPGPGGFRAQGRGVIDRPQIAFSRPDVQAALTKQLQSPDALRRLRAVDALGANAEMLAHAAETAALSQQAAALIKQAADGDASSLVRSAARQELFGLLKTEPEKAAMVSAMVRSPDLESRTFACLLTVNRPKPFRTELLQPLLTGGDDLSRALARAIIDLPDAPPPTTAPAAK